MNNLHTLFSLKDKVAIVTGGSVGLGYDIACALSEYGASVVITSRTVEKAENVARDIQATYGNKVVGCQLDQTDYQSCQIMADAMFNLFGRIDILVNNAGGGSGRGECNFFKREPEEIKDMVDCNLVGSLFCCQTVGRYMAEQRFGSIINIASIAAIIGRKREMYYQTGKMEQPVEYAASKAGVLGLTYDLAAFLAQYNVRVNAISPGGFDKGELPEKFVDAYARITPLGRMGVLHKEILGAALFLASEASSYVTAENIVVDGGFSRCR